MTDQPTDTPAPDAEPSAAEAREKTVRDHVTTLHLIGEQLAGIESWMWQHLADVRDRQAAAERAQQPTDPARRLSLQHTDALWDAVAIPGPAAPTFVEQHERVCRVVADILDELTPAPDEPDTDRAALRDRVADALAAADGWTWAPDFDRTLSPAWQGYRQRADAVLAVLPTTDQAAGWLDAAAECNKAGGAYAERGANAAAGAAFALMETFLRKAGEAEYMATPCSGPVPCEDGGEPCDTHERLMGHAEGEHELCAPDCGDAWLRRLAAEAQQSDTDALAALFEGFGRLLATSSRDWGQYAPDAWLYAVILGWDCEQAEHDETCTHGAMEEMQQRHGWDDETVAKARRYRAAVRALTESGQARQDEAKR